MEKRLSIFIYFTQVGRRISKMQTWVLEDPSVLCKRPRGFLCIFPLSAGKRTGLHPEMDHNRLHSKTLQILDYLSITMNTVQTLKLNYRH